MYVERYKSYIPPYVLYQYKSGPFLFVVEYGTNPIDIVRQNNLLCAQTTTMYEKTFKLKVVCLKNKCDRSQKSVTPSKRCTCYFLFVSYYECVSFFLCRSFLLLLDMRLACKRATTAPSESQIRHRRANWAPCKLNECSQERTCCCCRWLRSPRWSPASVGTLLKRRSQYLSENAPMLESLSQDAFKP